MYDSGVEYMYYIVCTFSYTSDPSRSYFYYVPCTHPQLVEEIHYVLYYYNKLGFLSSYFCQKVAFTKDELDDLKVLLNCNEVDEVDSNELLQIMPFLDESYASNQSVISMTFSDPPILGYVRLFNKLWYVPMFEGEHVKCMPVSNHLTLLLKWYQNAASSGMDRETIHMRLNKLVEQKDKSVEQKDKSIQYYEPVESVEPVEIDSRDVIDSYLELYLHPRKHQKVLLSNIYQDFTKKSKITISQAAFSKQLRTHTQYLIYRQSSGMMLNDYGIIDQLETYRTRQIIYMNFEDLFSIRHFNRLSKFNDKSFDEYRLIPFAREAYFLLTGIHKNPVTLAHVKFFVDDKHTQSVLECCQIYLNTFHSLETEKWNAIRHDDLNDTPKNQVIDFFNNGRRLNEFHYYPFSFTLLRPGVSTSSSTSSVDSNDSTFLNQYSYE